MNKTYMQLKNITDVFFNIRKEALNTSDGIFTGRNALIREDNNRVIGVVSPRYQVITNQEIVEPLERALNNTSLKWKYGNIISVKGGSKSFIDIIFPNESVKISNRVGDIISFKCTIINSFDGSHRFSINIGAVRLICSNGMTTMDKDNNASIVFKHSKNKINFELMIDMIIQSINKFKLKSNFYINLTKDNIDVQTGIEEIESICKDLNFSKKWTNQCKNIWLSKYDTNMIPNNRWGIYNTFTEYFTHSNMHPILSNRSSSLVDSYFRNK